MIADAVYKESQIGLKYQEEMKNNFNSGVQYNTKKPVEVQMKDDKDVDAHHDVTQWQEVKSHSIIQQMQEQEFTEIIKNSYGRGRSQFSSWSR